MTLPSPGIATGPGRLLPKDSVCPSTKPITIWAPYCAFCTNTAKASWLVAQVCAPGEQLAVVTLDAALESAILGGMRDPATGQPIIEPECAQMIGRRVAEITAGLPGGRRAALIVQPPARRALADLLRVRAPGCLVLSIAELPPSQPVEVVAVIGAPAGPTLEEPIQPKPQPELLAA